MQTTQRDAHLFCINHRQHTAKVMSDTIDELESEFEDEDEDQFDSTLAANKFRELMSALDVEESTQELAVAILKEEGLHAVQVKRSCRRSCLLVSGASLLLFSLHTLVQLLFFVILCCLAPTLTGRALLFLVFPYLYNRVPPTHRKSLSRRSVELATAAYVMFKPYRSVRRSSNWRRLHAF